MNSINRIILVERTKDHMVWISSSSGRFIFNSFRRSLAKVGEHSAK